MKKKPMNIVQMITELKQDAGLKQEFIANELGVSQATISRWISGSEPRGHHRDKLVEFYHKHLPGRFYNIDSKSQLFKLASQLTDEQRQVIISLMRELRKQSSN